MQPGQLSDSTTKDTKAHEGTLLAFVYPFVVNDLGGVASAALGPPWAA